MPCASLVGYGSARPRRGERCPARCPGREAGGWTCTYLTRRRCPPVVAALDLPDRSPVPRREARACAALSVASPRGASVGAFAVWSRQNTRGSPRRVGGRVFDGSASNATGTLVVPVEAAEAEEASAAADAGLGDGGGDEGRAAAGGAGGGEARAGDAGRRVGGGARRRRTRRRRAPRRRADGRRARATGTDARGARAAEGGGGGRRRKGRASQHRDGGAGRDEDARLGRRARGGRVEDESDPLDTWTRFVVQREGQQTDQSPPPDSRAKRRVTNPRFQFFRDDEDRLEATTARRRW